jgi:ferric-dicitrate binding protein FerR (iron transport regulator)
VNVKVGGNFRTTDLDSFTAAVQHMYGFRVQVGSNKGDIRLSASAQPP